MKTNASKQTIDEVIDITFLKIVSPVAKQHRHLRSENPTPSLNPATKLDAGVSPHIHTITHE